MKKRLLVFLAMACSLAGFSQLSERENFDFTYKLGARPQAGDGALQFVIPIVNLSSDSAGDAGLYGGNLLSSGDFLTYKYYHTDNDVFRIALRLQAQNAAMKGTVLDSGFFNPGSPSEQTLNQKSIMRQYYLAVGMEKHFTSSNIFDVYAGGDVLIGCGKEKTVNETDYFNGDKSYVTRSTPTTIFGIGLVTGFNIFVAELPVSVGLEYGLSAKWIMGGKTKVTEELISGDTNESGEWFETEFDAFGNPDSNIYSELKKKQFNMDTNHNVRLNIHFYFNTARD